MSFVEISPSVACAVLRLRTALGDVIGGDTSGILARDMLGLRRECGIPVLHTDGVRSLRGTARFLRFQDGWAVLNLARVSDFDLLPALTQGAVAVGQDFALADWASARKIDDVFRDAVDLGLAFARVGSVPQGVNPPFTYRPSGVALTSGGVVNLSGLWAGPLAGRILADSGLDVTILSSQSRPEPAQSDWAKSFTALMRHRQNLHVVPNLTHADARQTLDTAQVIITSSRLDGLARAGVVPRPDQLWLRITAYGSQGCNALRIGYGDDVGVAAGGAFWSEDGTPRFQGDAFPDPLTGMIGALALLQAQRRGEGGVVDVSLYDAATWALSGGQGWI